MADYNAMIKPVSHNCMHTHDLVRISLALW